MAATTSTRSVRGGRAYRCAAGVVLAASAALAVAGCSGPDETGGTSARTPQTSESPSAEPSAGRPSAKPSVSAADGRDVEACADGDCEIAVSKPVTFRFRGPAGPVTLSVTEVGPDRIQYTVTSGDNHSEGGATGPGQGCVTVLRTHGGGNSCGALGNAARPSPRPDAVVIQAATGTDGTAIVHIVSG